MSNTKIAEVVSSKIEDGQRLIKIIVMGKDDVHEIHQVTPFGIDSNPIKGSKALHVQTLQMGESVVAGTINEATDLAPGEIRIFSTDEDGVEQAHVTIRTDGTIEIGGTAHNMVRYTPLNAGIQQFKADVNVQFGLIAAVLNGLLPGSYVAPVLTVDISGSKIDEVKTL